MRSFILYCVLLFSSINYGQGVESKIENTIINHIEEYRLNNKDINNLIVFYENTFYDKLYENKNIIVLNNRNDLKRLIKNSTYLINFKTVIKDDKLYIYALHFKVEKNKKGINMINQMDGKDYYICDLIIR